MQAVNETRNVHYEELSDLIENQFSEKLQFDSWEKRCFRAKNGRRYSNIHLLARFPHLVGF